MRNIGTKSHAKDHSAGGDRLSGELGSGDALIRTMRPVAAALSGMATAAQASVNPHRGPGESAAAGQALAKAMSALQEAAKDTNRHRAIGDLMGLVDLVERDIGRSEAHVIRAGVDADDHPEPGQQRGQLIEWDHLARPLSRLAVPRAAADSATSVDATLPSIRPARTARLKGRRRVSCG